MSATNPVNYTLLKLSANAYAQTAADIGINLDGSTPFSIDAWIKFNGLCSSASILSKQGVFDLGISGNTVIFQISGYPPVQSKPSVTALDDETWHYICVTYSGGQVRIYIDGEFNVLQGISGSGTTGSDPYLLGNGLQALMKAVRVYNKELDRDTVFANMYNDPEASTIVAWFDFLQNPPKDKGSQDLPIQLKENAKMVINFPALSLTGTAYAKPLHDKMVNPGGYQVDPYTVQTWVYVADTNVEQQMIFINDDLEMDSGMALYLEYDSMAAGFFVKSQRGSSDSEDDILTSTNTVSPNTWVNLATTFDGTTLSIYVNGVLDTSGAFGPIPNIQLESQLVIGAGQSAGIPTGTACFQGYISHVSVWETALSAADIVQYMEAAPAVDSEGLQAIYNFESAPARNMVNGHPIGLTDGAELSHQSGPAPDTVEEISYAYEDHGISQDAIDSIRESLDLSDFMKENGEQLEKARQASLDELSTMFTGKELDKARQKLDTEWKEITGKYQNNPKEIPFLLTDHKIEGKDVMLCHTKRGTHVAYVAEEDTISDCTMWKVRLVFIVVAGFLDAFFGLSARLEQKVINFISTRVLVNAAIRARIAAGVAITAMVIFQVGQIMYRAGLLKDLVKLMVDLGWWALFRMLAKLVLKFIGVGAADTIASLAATVILFIKEYNERPSSCDPLPTVTLAAIKFNYDTGNKGLDAINIRENYTTPVTIPEWQPGNINAADSPAAYSIKETSGKTVSVQVKFNIDTKSDTSLQIQATGGGILGAIDPVTVTFKNGVSDPEYVTIPLSHLNIAGGGINKADISWVWQYQPSGGSWTTMATTNHRIYVVLESPNLPWTPDELPSDTQVPWTDVLDFACDWANGKTNQTDAATAITTQVNGAIGLTYDTSHGASVYTLRSSGGKYQFLCTEFLEFLNGGTGKGRIVNCTDCATIVATFANSIGCNITESTMYSVAGGQLDAFKCNKIIAIGGTAWDYPFPPGNQFAYHEVGWIDGLGYNDMIFDACLKLDNSNDPWNQPDSGRVAKLPTNVKFTTLPMNPTLPVGTPFTSWDYRERLAQNNSNGIGKCVPRGPFPDTQNGRRLVI